MAQRKVVKKPVVMPLRLERELVDMLRKQAAREHRTMANLMRLILESGVTIRKGMNA